jgi:predicted transposase YbfD/YdcC
VRVPGRAETQETRYFVTCVSPEKVTPEDLLRLVRGHWQVENSLHYIRDRWWDEDRHWLKRPGLAERLATLLGAALSLLRTTPHFDPTMPIRAKADEIAANPRLALNLIGALE